MIFPILSAILGILAFLPFDYFWPFGFIFLVPLFIFLIKEKSFGWLILGVLIFRIIFSLGTVYFTFEPILWLLSILFFLGLPIAVYFIKKLINILINKYSFKYQLPTANYYLLILLPFLWTFFDHFQARYSLFPTYIMTVGNSLGSSPFLGLANFDGLIFLTFFAASINALIGAALATINGSKKIKPIIILVIITVIILVFGWQISQFQLQKNSKAYKSLENSLKIATISINENFNYPDLEKIKNEIINNENEIDFLILPEDIFNNAPQELDIKFWRDFAKEMNINLLATGDRRENNKRYNSSVLMDKNGEIADIYDKNRLTFIGEYWPFGKWTPSYLNWLLKTQPEIKNYAVFNLKNAYFVGDQKLLTAKFNNEELKLTSLICLEIHYIRDLKKYKKMGAQLFINPASNRWLNLGLFHFLYSTNNLRRIQSVWLKKPIILSGVKDFAGVIEPTGINHLIKFEEKNKNYGLFIGEIKY